MGKLLCNSSWLSDFMLGLLALLIGGSAAAQATYPVKPVRLVVAFPPGGADDAHGRLLAEKLGDLLGRQFIVDNRPGAGGVIGQDAVAKATPDGYTLLVAGSSIVLKPSFYPKMPYDLTRDLTAISQIGGPRIVLVVHPSMPAKSVKDLIALAKAKPGKLNFASSGLGGMPHLSGELFEQMAHINIVHVPYKGGGPAMVDLMAGHVDMSFATMGSSIGMISGGKLRPLAVTSSTRSRLLPDVPTMIESGLREYEMTSWYALFAPAATPRDIVSQLNAAVVNAVASPDLQEGLRKIGSEPVSSSSEQMTQRLRNDTTTLTKIVKAAGITGEQ